MAAASERREFGLLVLPGDGVGPEITREALRVADWFADRLGLKLNTATALVGGASIDAHGMPITDDVAAQALAADAVLFGAVGGPRWDDRPISARPEAGILRLRKDLDLYANLRPAVCFSELADASALKREVVDDLDILIVREATAGVYFGQPRGVLDLGDGRSKAYDTQAYRSDEVERVVRTAFEIARTRSRRLCSVDKANVMETGAFWRRIATRLGADYPDVELSHMYADNCAMQLVRAPKQFDVIVTDNLFGDILSDEAAALVGSLGMLPSASLGPERSDGGRRALYEPIHGSAPDIAGQGIANPLAAILSFGLCLRWSLGQAAAADLLDRAVRQVIARGVRTPDIARAGTATVSTVGMGDAVLVELDRLAQSSTVVGAAA